MELNILKFPHKHLVEVESTNAFLIDYIAKITPVDGFCVFSDFQTAGKGQYGRTWDSERSKNILASFVFNTTWLKEKEIFFLHQISSLAVQSIVKKYLPFQSVKIKWPNDILVNIKKIAGILIQNVFRGQQLIWSIIGIGLNVNQNKFGSDLNATSLILESEKNYDLNEILTELHKELMTFFEVKKKNHDFDLLDDYNQELFGLNESLNFQKVDGELFIGRLLAVDELGQIKIEIDNQLLTYNWSEVRLIRH